MTRKIVPLKLRDLRLPEYMTIKDKSLMKGHTTQAMFCPVSGRGKDDCRYDGDRPGCGQKDHESYIEHEIRFLPRCSRIHNGQKIPVVVT